MRKIITWNPEFTEDGTFFIGEPYPVFTCFKIGWGFWELQHRLGTGFFGSKWSLLFAFSHKHLKRQIIKRLEKQGFKVVNEKFRSML